MGKRRKDGSTGLKIGDSISMNFNAPEAGEYEVTATYRSGRSEGGTPNAFVCKEQT